jgi:hypothetical protein
VHLYFKEIAQKPAVSLKYKRLIKALSSI